MSTIWSHCLYFASSCAVSSLISFAESLRRVGAGVDGFAEACCVPAAAGAAPGAEPGPSTPSFFAPGSGTEAIMVLMWSMPSVEIDGSGLKMFASSMMPPIGLRWRLETSSQAS
jgi:hypothetical protein